MYFQIKRGTRAALGAVMCVASLSACGGGAGASAPVATPAAPAMLPPASEPSLRAFVGAVGAPDAPRGLADGVGALARFAYPQGIAMDARGNIYVADTANDALRQVTPAGAVATLARLPAGTAPNGLTVDAADTVYFIDSGANVQRLTAAGTASALALPTALFDPLYRFQRAKAIGVDGAGNIYIEFRLALQALEDCGSYGPHACQLGFKTSVQQLTPSGYWGTVAAVASYQSAGMAVDRAGTVYLSGYADNTILKIASSGQVTTFAGMAGESGTADGMGPAARFFQPGHLAADAAGNVYVDDAGNHAIRKITPDGRVSTIAGSATLAPGALAGSVPVVGGLAVDAEGYLVVSVPHGLIKILLR